MGQGHLSILPKRGIEQTALFPSLFFVCVFFIVFEVILNFETTAIAFIVFMVIINFETSAIVTNVTLNLEKQLLSLQFFPNSYARTLSY